MGKLIGVASMLGLALVVACGTRPPATLVIRHARVYTVDSALPWAQAVAVQGERIVYVGPDSGIARWIGDSTRVIDGQGGMLLPGFVDAHVHPSSGIDLAECEVSADTSAAQLLEHIRSCAAAKPAEKWIRGSGWQLPLFPKANPTAAFLDQAVSERPAFFWAADGHSGWANTRAMTLAGISRETRDPPNGRIERDALGNPTGTLRERAADLVSHLLPPYAQADYIEGYRRAFAMGNAFGITAMIEANADSLMLSAYQVMEHDSSLTVRMTAAQETNSDSGPGQVARLERLRAQFKGPMLDPNSAKIFEDGVIESGTAALLLPYLNRPGNAGTPNLEAAPLDSLIDALDKAGFQVHVHAIGDRAIRLTLDAFEHARRANGARDSRPIIAHLELIDPQDIPRFKSFGVIADFQPLWAFQDSYIEDLTEPVLGPARSRWLYPIGSVLKTGAVVAGGSDWSVSSMNPLEAIQVAVTRRSPEADSGAAWIPEELAPLDAMIRAYTMSGAYARFADSTTGSITVGKLADLVLLDRDLFAIPAQEIDRTKVRMTILGGRVVYEQGGAGR
ncbi:MAG: amidohydrolase [Gemmatimonadota bacterium]